MQKKTLKFFLVIIFVAASVYILMQGIMFFSRPVTTERLVSYTGYDYFETKAVVTRNEKIINTNKNGVLDYIFSDGEKVRINSEIAYSYAADTDISIILRIRELEEKIAALKKIDNTNIIYYGDALKIETSIENSIMSISQNVSSKDYVKLTTNTDVLLNYFNMKQLILGEIENFSEKISKLQTELDTLTQNKPNAYSSITTDTTGYFSSSFDGYENIFTPTSIKFLNPVEFKDLLGNIKPAEKTKGYVGKIVTDSYWYLSFTAPSDSCYEFNEGDTIRLKMPDILETELKAIVEYKRIKDNICTILLKGDTLPNIFVNQRFVDIKIIKSSYKCYKINEKALRMYNNVTGIYVLVGQQVQFKPVEFIAFEDKYAHIRSSDDRLYPLMANEEVIVKGKNLFDGKIIG